MQNPAATLYCPNPYCQAPNPQSHIFCQNCRTPLCRRYLWAVGESIEAYSVGQLIQERYLLLGDRILLDTKPGQPPAIPTEIPPELAPYLKLSPYRLHVPQVYGLLLRAQGRQSPRTGETWLLEEAPIYITGDSSGSLMPELTSVWQNATAISQISWLWQIASLWQPLSTYGVSASLLSPTSLRLEGSLVRLLELQEDSQSSTTLQHLGHLWWQWASLAHPAVKDFIEQLSSGLLKGQIKTSEQLVELLDRGLAEQGRSLEGKYQIFTCTDQGPSRRRNEDACYPPSGTQSEIVKNKLEVKADQEHLSQFPVAVVCDGIGGHEGGDVASTLAIETIRQQVENLLSSQDIENPVTLTLGLERAALSANEAISQRNDSERRQDRQRMGTTVVMALVQAHEIYITHVGDSRVYRVTRTGCHQVTQDDDLASREVRLGYAFYRDAVQQPASGSLVQALGMGSSSMLHPTVQRFILDEDCIFLLCSDGLSDNDRVEQYWETEIVPILDGQIDLATAGKRLINLGNTQNGHDNVTVALVYCQLKQLEAASHTHMPPVNMEFSSPNLANSTQTIFLDAAPSQMKTQQLPQYYTSSRPWIIVLCCIVLGLLGGVVFYFWPSLAPQISQSPNQAPKLETSPPNPSEASPSSEANAVADRALLKIQSDTTKNSKGQSVPLSMWRDFTPPAKKLAIGKVPANSVLLVIKSETSQDQESWLKLKVCSTPDSNPKAQAAELASTQIATRHETLPPKTKVGQPLPTSSSQPNSITNGLVQPGDIGWIPRTEVVPVSQKLNDPRNSASSAVLAECLSNLSVSPSPTSTATP